MPYKDPEKQKKAVHESYLRTKDRFVTRRQERRHKNKKWFREEILPKYKCIVCGETDPVVLDFHHLDPSIKRQEVPKMVAENRNRDVILAEIEKCVCLCANDHRRVHAGTIKLAGEVGIEPT